jgi:hypothetical protein
MAPTVIRFRFFLLLPVLTLPPGHLYTLPYRPCGLLRGLTPRPAGARCTLCASSRNTRAPSPHKLSPSCLCLPLSPLFSALRCSTLNVSADSNGHLSPKLNCMSPRARRLAVLHTGTPRTAPPGPTRQAPVDSARRLPDTCIPLGIPRLRMHITCGRLPTSEVS